MSLNDWSSWNEIGGTVIALATLAATILTAVNTNRLNKKIHAETEARIASEKRQERVASLRGQKAAIRESRQDFISACSKWVAHDSQSGDFREPLSIGTKLLALVENAGNDTALATGMLHALDGQSWWVTAPDRHLSWANRVLDGCESADEQAEALTNGLLDTVKDKILNLDATGYDGDYLKDGFFTTLATDRFHVPLTPDAIFARPSEDIFATAEKRWISADAPKPALTRLAALVRYKVLAEYSISAFWFGKFTNNLHHKEYGERFLASNKHTLELLRDEIADFAQNTLAEIETKIQKELA